MTKKSELIRTYLLEGRPYSEICKLADCASATVSWHANKLNIPRIKRPNYNWEEIQIYHNSGHTMKECMHEFGFSRGAWSRALRNKKLIPTPLHRPFKTYTLEEILIENSLYRNNTELKTRLIKKGLLIYNCYGCGISEWNNKYLVLELDHINGISNDNRLKNLRLLCPNCHSQTKTYRGRNSKIVPDMPM